MYVRRCGSISMLCVWRVPCRVVHSETIKTIFTAYLISGNAITADVEKAAFPLSTPWSRVGEEEAWLHSFLTSALDGDDWSTWSSGLLTPCKNRGADWIESWVGSRVSVDILEKRNISFTAGIRNPYYPVRGLTTIPTYGLVGRSEGMRLLVKPRSRWEGKISCHIMVRIS